MKTYVRIHIIMAYKTDDDLYISLFTGEVLEIYQALYEISAENQVLVSCCLEQVQVYQTRTAAAPERLQK